ncbi:MAG: malate/lactate/ureidoglycolate dehydrogenase [Gammaproteobacteria bacterium]|nr:malate/lactate/ureidoglycolate dehydrogenase [Gammaproteobacteria bacterium]
MLISEENLVEFTTRIFVSAGTHQDKAAEVAEHLVAANLKGHDSHGVGMIPTYIRNLVAGNMKPNADAEVIVDKGAVLLVDGNFGFGQVVGRQAVDLGIERAKNTGVVCVGSRNNHHLGRIGSYAEKCASEGFVSIHFVNVVGHPPFVSPWGGRDKRMQTNPFCCAIPTSGDPVVLDMATSAIALGKVRVADMKGVPVPEGSLYDAEGVETTDPSSIQRGGSLAPFGKHKGYGLALICELLGGGLAGEWTMQDISKQKDNVINHMLMIILDPDLFGGSKAFLREIEGMGDYLHSTTPAKNFDKVRLPGEPERESMAERRKNGIPIDDQSWKTICDAALQAGLNQEEINQAASNQDTY